MEHTQELSAQEQQVIRLLREIDNGELRIIVEEHVPRSAERIYRGIPLISATEQHETV